MHMRHGFVKSNSRSLPWCDHAREVFLLCLVQEIDFFVLYISNSPYEVCKSTESAIVDVQHFMSVVVVCRKDDEPDALGFMSFACLCIQS